MSNINWNKVLKTVGILIVVGLVIWYFEGRSLTKSAKTDDVLTKLSYVSDELVSLGNKSWEACESEDYDEMHYALAQVEDKYKELQEIVDKAYKYFSPKEPEYDERRSWWY